MTGKTVGLVASVLQDLKPFVVVLRTNRVLPIGKE